jgi:hypothetical protein
MFRENRDSIWTQEHVRCDWRWARRGEGIEIPQFSLLAYFHTQRYQGFIHRLRNGFPLTMNTFNALDFNTSVKYLLTYLHFMMFARSSIKNLMMKKKTLLI